MAETNKPSLRIKGRGAIMRKTWPTGEDMFKTFMEYFKYVEEENLMPTYPGWFVFAGISKATFYNYRNDKDGEYDDTIDLIENALQDNLLQEGFKNPKESAMHMFTLKTLHKYNDRGGVNVNVGIQTNILNTHKLDEATLNKMRDQFNKNRELEQERLKKINGPEPADLKD